MSQVFDVEADFSCWVLVRQDSFLAALFAIITDNTSVLDLLIGTWNVRVESGVITLGLFAYFFILAMFITLFYN